MNDVNDVPNKICLSVMHYSDWLQDTHLINPTTKIFSSPIESWSMLWMPQHISNDINVQLISVINRRELLTFPYIGGNFTSW